MEGILTSATLMTSESESQQSPGHESGGAVAEPPLTGEKNPEPSDHPGQVHAESVLTPEEEAELRRIKDLPREVGVMLMTVGVLGFILPGVVGTPAAIAGGLVLWPKTFGRVENWFERRFPKIHKQSLYQINRYLNDLESRYPDLTRRE